MLGHPQTHLPDNMKNKGTNRYFMLPLILGLIGFFFQLRREPRGTFVVILLFIMTGLAIVIYLNQKPFEPRERDYSYCGSTYAFAIWIGLGVIWLIQILKKILKREYLAIALASVATLILVPGIMAKENWDDHDRSGKYSCRDFAAGYLNSCGKQGILFTNGDNDTFPLWYDQEVEGIRTDVRVVNLMLASGSEYIDNLFKKAYESEPMPFSIPREKYQPGSNDYIPFYDIGFDGYIELKDLIGFIKSDDPRTFLTANSGEKIKFFPSKKVKITVDREACLKYGIVPQYLADKIVDSVCWTIKTNTLRKNDIMLLDLVANNEWQRPLYFASHSSVSYCFDVDTFCFVEGWVYKFMPVQANKEDYIKGMGGVDPLGSYDILMNKCAWGNLNDPHVYVDPESLNTIARPKTNIFRTAEALIGMGKTAEAIRLMDSYFIHFPDSRISYDMYDLPYADLYYKAGQPLKANKIIDRIGKIYSQDLEFYYSFKDKYRHYYQGDIEQALGILRRMSIIASDNKQFMLSKKMEDLFNKEIKSYR
jgi:hypothetical protein